MHKSALSCKAHDELTSYSLQQLHFQNASLPRSLYSKAGRTGYGLTSNCSLFRLAVVLTAAVSCLGVTLGFLLSALYVSEGEVIGENSKVWTLETQTCSVACPSSASPASNPTPQHATFRSGLTAPPTGFSFLPALLVQAHQLW